MLTNVARLAAAAAATAAGVGLIAPSAWAVAPAGNARGVTTVELTSAAVGALGPLAPAPVAPAVLGGSPLVAAFPVVGNQNAGVVKHVGGLSLTGAAGTLSLTNYDIVLSQGVLTADASLNGSDLGRIPLFTVTPEATAPGCFASAELFLSPQAAGALSSVFGTSTALSGADIGTACVALRG